MIYTLRCPNKISLTSNTLHFQIIRIKFFTAQENLQDAQINRIRFFSPQMLYTFNHLNKIFATQIRRTFSKIFFKTQASQTMCYWSLNTFKALKEFFKLSKHLNQTF